MSGVPDEVLAFFERTKFRSDAVQAPWWLKSVIDDVQWLIDIGKNDIRRVNDRTRGGLVIRWDTLLPLGRLTDALHSKLCAQCKELLIAVADARSSTRSLQVVFRTLMNFVEFLALKYQKKLCTHGLLVAHIDDVEEFLDAHVEAGTCATGQFIERFEDYLEKSGLPRADRDMAALHAIFGSSSGNQLSFAAIGEAISVDMSRLRTSHGFRNHLVQYGYRHKSESEPSRRTTNGYVDVLNSLGEASLSVPALRAWALGDSQALRDACRPYRGCLNGRTPTMPPSVRDRLTLSACSWMLEEAPALEATIKAFADRYAGMDLGSTAAFVTQLSLDEEQVVWGTLQKSAEFVAQRYSGRSARKGSRAKNRQLPLLIGILRIHLGVCYALTCLLSCSRRIEICDLSSDALFSMGGRDFLTVSQAKRGGVNVRPTFDKPVPRIVGMALSSIERIKSNLIKILPVIDHMTHQRAFMFLGLQGLRPFDINDSVVVLRLISAYFDFRDEDGSPWTIATHQLRRSFAMTFFHSEGAEATLPALAWLMGHHSVEMTWRYVRESMTGKELSEAEARMAMASITANEKSESVRRLGELLLEHFGCHDLSVLDVDEATEYLEMLSETGEISVSPIQIATGDRKTFTVLVSFKGDP